MRLLLDTQVALWALADSPRLSSAASELIGTAANDIYFSAATIWEIAIKHALVRADMPISGAEARRLLAAAGFEELPITAAHAAATEDLPAHHADPFDRILVAQSIVEPMRLLSHDRLLILYGDAVHYV